MLSMCLFVVLPAEKFWVAQAFGPVCYLTKQTRIMDVISKFEDTGVLEYPMTEFPVPEKSPYERTLLAEAIGKLKPAPPN